MYFIKIGKQNNLLTRKKPKIKNQINFLGNFQLKLIHIIDLNTSDMNQLFIVSDSILC